MEYTRVDSDGTLHIPGYTLRQSNFVSKEFQQAYAAHLAAAQQWPMTAPPMGASKAEWDRYDAEADRLIFGPSVKEAEAFYAVDVEDTTIAGVHVGIVTPKEGIAPQNKGRVLINLHGGGFTIGRGLTAGKGEAIPVAATGRIRVVTVDYRMAPYARFPAASEDVEAVYRELLKAYRPEQIGIFGCSAGGILAAQAVAWFQARGLPRPGAVGIFAAAPMPLWITGDSTAWGGVGILQPGLAIPDPASVGPATSSDSQPAGPMEYIGGASMDDPCANPSASDEVMAAFPPTLWITGTRSFDMSPVIVCHARFLKLGVDSHLYVLEGGQHGAYNIGQNMTSEGWDTVAHIARFFGRYLAI